MIINVLNYLRFADVCVLVQGRRYIFYLGRYYLGSYKIIILKLYGIEFSLYISSIVNIHTCMYICNVSMYVHNIY
jgi:hypothetical protein